MIFLDWVIYLCIDSSLLGKFSAIFSTKKRPSCHHYAVMIWLGSYVSPFCLMLTWLWFNGLSLRNVMRRWNDFWTIHFIMRIVVRYCRQASCTFATMISQVFCRLRLNFWRMWQSWWTGASSSTRCGTYASVFFYISIPGLHPLEMYFCLTCCLHSATFMLGFPFGYLFG